ncbi:restriction endonuclease subunit S, partial [candidate division WOR-3 bacterium]|nr:restriction endonuclease subunit S [candidate division WOR-3 bacterium]
ATPKNLAPLDVPVLLDTERRITDAGVQQISSGLLPVGTVLLSSRAPIGYLAIAETPVAINQGFIAMLPKDAVSNLFLLHWTRYNHEVIVGRANGTTFLEISKSDFRPIPVAVPRPDVMEAFDIEVRPLYRRVVANTRESRALTAIRDALLPKLMSGEIRTTSDEVRRANNRGGRKEHVR